MADIHVAIVCQACGGDGSVAAVAVHQAGELAKHFDRVTLLSDSMPVKMPYGVHGVTLRSTRAGWLRRFAHVPNEILFCLSVRTALREISARNRVQLVIYHGHASAALCGIPLRRRLGIPYAVVTHGDIFDRPRGTYDPRLTAFYRYVSPPAYRNADLVVALSPHMADCALRAGARRDAVQIVPNGIDPWDIGLSEEIEGESGADHRSVRPLAILYVGALSQHKGVPVLLEAVRAMRNEGVAFSLRLVGRGPEEHNLKAYIEANLGDCDISFIGTKPRDQLGALYMSADVVCAPSISEPLSMVVLEALCAGIPVVGSDVGGIPSLVKDRTNGLLVPPGDVNSLSAALMELALDRGLRDSLAGRARKSVWPRLSWPQVGDQLASHVKDVVVNEKQWG